MKKLIKANAMKFKNNKNIIVVDDDSSIRVVLSSALTRAGYNVKSSGTATGMMRLVESNFADVLITDVGLPDGDALDILPKLQKMVPNLKIIVMSARTTLLTAIRAEKKGAYDYLPKPFDLEELLKLVSRTFLLDPINKNNNSFNFNNQDNKNIYDAGPVIGKSSIMQDIYKKMSRLITNNLSVLITGDSGTGKNIIARAIHDLSSKYNNPFIKLNMDFFNKEVKYIDITNFYTQNNINQNTNSLENFDDCTILINEISDFSLVQQFNLLNFLEINFELQSNEKKFLKNNRIISTTRKNIIDMVNKGLFREDLFYRLNVVHIKLPTLKERPEDINDLSLFFLNNYFFDKKIKKSISIQGLSLFRQYPWPGNIREFKNVINRLCILSSNNEISANLISHVLNEVRNTNDYDEDNQNIDTLFYKGIKNYFKTLDKNMDIKNLYDEIISKIEKPLIESTLNLYRGNQIKASNSLGLNRNTLRKKINLHGINIIKKIKL